jgi:signal transduction histidine kinase
MREHGRRGERPRYPPWLSEEQFGELYEQAGLQRFLLILSARDVRSQIVRDFWERIGLMVAALLALSAVWFGWRSLQRATQLGLRLVRAQEMNTHLREMNTAAAGLAHETRNPLNSVRGLAQMIANDSDSGSQSRSRARTVMAEVDRINSRLGEFLAYSRPKPPRQTPLDLSQLVSDVLRTLDTDREEKHLEVETAVPPVQVMADEGQFRQVLFNLLLNAYQASPEGGTVWIEAEQQEDGIAVAVRDQGPGVPGDAREDIFRPYFVLNEQGTGLGLAVTRQIVLAHHWDVACLAPPAGGAEFRVTGIQPA